MSVFTSENRIRLEPSADDCGSFSSGLPPLFGYGPSPLVTLVMNRLLPGRSKRAGIPQANGANTRDNRLMATLGLIEYADASPEVRAVYDDIMNSRKTDWINNFWKALAHDPVTLRRTRSEEH